MQQQQAYEFLRCVSCVIEHLDHESGEQVENYITTRVMTTAIDLKPFRLTTAFFCGGQD